MYDIIIIGMGMSGITSAIYAQRKNLKVLLLDKSMPGGMLNNLDKIANYPGYIDIKGPDLALNLFNQIKALNINYALEEVIDITVNDKVVVKTKNHTYEALDIILATGKKAKPLVIEGEKDYFGRGLSSCAVCDGYFYKDKDVAVVGSNKLAIREALYLSNIVHKLYFITKEKTINDDIKKVENIEVILDDEIVKIKEKDNLIDSVILKSSKTIPVKGIFVYNGFIPNSSLVEKYNITNEAGFVMVDNNYETKIPHLYAIGDVIKKDVYQLVTAAADGAKVINNIIK